MKTLKINISELPDQSKQIIDRIKAVKAESPYSMLSAYCGETFDITWKSMYEILTKNPRMLRLDTVILLKEKCNVQITF